MKGGPKGLKISFSSQRLTHFRGLHLFQGFFLKNNLRVLMNQHLRFSSRNNRSSIAEGMLALIYPMVVGLSQIETTQLLKHNSVFQYLTGLSASPNPTTLRLSLLRIASRALPRFRRLHDRLLGMMATKPRSPHRTIFDLDFPVPRSYGRQEVAAAGYNPMKNGRKSYYPLLCFNGRTRDLWQGELRPGDVHTSSGVIDLLKETFAKLPESVQIVIIRRDKVFFDHKTIEFLESRRAHFVIVARLSRPIKAKISSLPYTAYRSGLEEAEFFYQPILQARPYCFILIRRPIPQRTIRSVEAFFYRGLQLSGV
ncbi:MAG: transposase [Candidatus Aminicenantales bacterium]